MIARPCLLRQAGAVKPPMAVVRIAHFSSLRPATRTQTISQLAKPASFRGTPAGVSRVAVFHSSARREILPAKPQEIEGTANEAAIVPEPHSLEGAYHWTFERVISAALVPVTIAPFVGSSVNPVLDAAFCGLLVLHTHIGFQSIITDYLPKRRVPKTRKLCDYGLIAGTVVVAYGLWEFETNDVGLVEGVKRVWKA